MAYMQEAPLKMQYSKMQITSTNIWLNILVLKKRTLSFSEDQLEQGIYLLRIKTSYLSSRYFQSCAISFNVTFPKPQRSY